MPVFLCLAHHCFRVGVLAEKPFPRNMLQMGILIQMKLFHLLQWQLKPSSRTYKAADSEGSSVLMATRKRRTSCQGVCKPVISASHVVAVTMPFIVLMLVFLVVLTCLMSNMVTDFFLQFKAFGCINTLEELGEQHHDWKQDTKSTVFRDNWHTVKTQ